MNLLVCVGVSAYEKQLQEYEITVFGSGGSNSSALNNNTGFNSGYPPTQLDPSNVIFGSTSGLTTSTLPIPTFTPLDVISSASLTPGNFIFGAGSTISQNGPSPVIGDAQMDNR